MLHQDLTEKILAAAFTVHNTLGPGFLEKVYKNALHHELRKAGLTVLYEHPIPVFYDNILVGDYIADLIVENTIIIELKVVVALDKIHFAQCLNYLKSTNLPICLLLNFATTRLQYHRITPKIPPP